MTKALDEMHWTMATLELVIEEPHGGQERQRQSTTASYTLCPDGNGFTLTPDHAKTILRPRCALCPPTVRLASNWFYFLPDAAKAQLP